MTAGREQIERLAPQAGDRPLFGLRRVEQIMGTAISVDVRDPEVPPAALDEAFDHLRDIDRRFSTYKPDSEVSRLSRGELSEDDCSGRSSPGPSAL